MPEWLTRMFVQILSVASGPIREELVNFCIDFRKRAAKTPNPWDDMLADILCWVVSVPKKNASSSEQKSAGDNSGT